MDSTQREVTNIYQRLRRLGSAVYHLPREAKRSAEFRRAKSTLSSGNITASEVRLLQEVSLRVNPADAMYGPNDSALDYLTAGLSAVRCIQAAIDANGYTESVDSVLDFPCGYGRVLRFLKVLYPKATIVAGEINTDALDFCRRVFSVKVFLSKGDFDHLAYPQKFNLIWCGSLVTHVDEKSTAALLRFMYRHLADGGVCLFTTHGQTIVNAIRGKKLWFRLTPEGEAEMLRRFEGGGFGY